MPSESVGQPSDFLMRVPGQLSGGQRQRVAVAPALLPERELLLLDEPGSALDVSIRAQVLNLLADRRRDRGLGYLAVSHDLSVLRFLSHDVGVMHGGRIVERGSVERVTPAPEHDDTRRLPEAAATIARSLDRWRQVRRARMCDTMIAMGTITGTGRTCLAKTSDREPNEAQYLTPTPAAVRTLAATPGALQADRLPPRGGDLRGPYLKEVAVPAPATAVKEPA
ncbi:ABC transporter, nucleotide binding/ATPase protein [Citreicella sp. SE45]|nr:ABC transporter, nucleotide binding/ATPase protein [Citreicella sp. SE45]